MYRGHWLEGADRSADFVLDTNGIVFEVTGVHEDGSLELVTVAAPFGRYPANFDTERAADVWSDLDPLIEENARTYAGVGFIGDSFPTNI